MKDHSHKAVSDEKDLIDAVARFASLPSVEFATQVYEIFDPFAIDGRVKRLAEKDVVGGKIFENDRRKLVFLFEKISANLDVARKELRDSINELIIDKKAYIVPYLATEGRLKPRLFGVESGIYLAVALLLDPNRPFGKRLHLCGKQDCTRWFITEHSRGGNRRAARYCCKEHRIEQDKVNNVIRMRNRNRGKKRLAHRL